MGCLKILHNEQKSALNESWKIFVGGVEKSSSSEKNRINYYPFGMVMPNRSFSSNSYRYGFNGKEKDPEGMGGGGSTYDYGFRIYNPQIAKFLSVDPLAQSYPWYTPYQFAGNMPIWAIDLDGLEEKIVIYYKDLHTGKTMISEVMWSDIHPGETHGKEGTGLVIQIYEKDKENSAYVLVKSTYYSSWGDIWDAIIEWDRNGPLRIRPYSSESNDSAPEKLPSNTEHGEFGNGNETVKSPDGGLMEGESGSPEGSGPTDGPTDDPADKQYSDKNQSTKPSSSTSSSSSRNYDNALNQGDTATHTRDHTSLYIKDSLNGDRKAAPPVVWRKGGYPVDVFYSKSKYEAKRSENKSTK